MRLPSIIRLVSRFKPYIYVLLSLFSGLTNYLYFPLTKHFLGLQKFGVVVAYASIVAVFGAILIAQQLYAIGHVTNRQVGEQLQAMIKLRDKAMLLGFILTVLYLVFGMPLLHILKIDDRWSFWLILLLLWVTAIANLIVSYWQAKSHFLKLGVFLVITSSLQLVITYVLLHIRADAPRALLALLLGQTTTVVFVVIYFSDIRHFLRHKIAVFARSSKDSGELLVITTIVFGLYAFLNLDVFVAKHYLTAADNGYYAIYATILKILFFILTPTIGYSLPGIAGLSSEKRSTLLRWLARQITLLAIGLVFIATIVFNFAVHLVYGVDAKRLVDLRWLLLPMTAAVIGVYAVVTIQVILRQYRRAGTTISIALVACFFSVLYLNKTLLLGPLSVVLGASTASVYLALSNLSHRYKSGPSAKA